MTSGARSLGGCCVELKRSEANAGVSDVAALAANHFGDIEHVPEPFGQCSAYAETRTWKRSTFRSNPWKWTGPSCIAPRKIDKGRDPANASDRLLEKFVTIKFSLNSFFANVGLRVTKIRIYSGTRGGSRPHLSKRMIPWIAGQLILLAVVAATPGWATDSLRIGGTGWSIGISRLLAQAYTDIHPNVSIDVPSSVGSTGGIRALIAGEFDLAISARQLEMAEKDQGLAAVPFVKTPFAFFVPTLSGNEALSLSEREVIGLYDGEYVRWPNGMTVRPILRLLNETNSRLLMAWFKGLGPVLEKALKVRGALIAYSDQEAMSMAERIPGAVATGAMLAALSEARNLGPIAIDGNEPTVDNLEKGMYNLSATLWLAERRNSGELARAFRKFMLSPAGEKIIRSNGGILLTHE